LNLSFTTFAPTFAVAAVAIIFWLDAARTAFGLEPGADGAGLAASDRRTAFPRGAAGDDSRHGAAIMQAVKIFFIFPHFEFNETTKENWRREVSNYV
jgi:hypothetical protein